MNAPKEAKCCPFCGSSDIRIAERDMRPDNDWLNRYGASRQKEWVVECVTCGAVKYNDCMSNGYYTRQDCIDAWNKRV